MSYGLGRRHAPDPRDHHYLLSEIVPTSTRTSRFWWGYRVRLDQGQTPMCVAYGWSHFITDAPNTHPAPIIAPPNLYHEAQQLDEWPGEDYDGTSVRGGVKALAQHQEVSEYRWAFDLDTIVNTVLEQGPVVVGVNWYDSMFEVGPDRFVRITAEAQIAGGHAFKLDGVNVPERFLRLKNSWGPSWGHGGFARISFDDMARLLSEDGEACLASETS